jgi:para-nitrobenzyl esterase
VTHEIRLPSRRAFIKHASLVLPAGSVLLRRAHAAETFVTADTAFGKLRGVETDGIRVFKGVPYGASTAGNNRFMAPVEPEPWTGVRDALNYGPSAPQRQPGAAAGGGASVSGEGLPGESEDCLVLNVWTPAVKDNAKRPVMVWLHGGGFATGSGSAPTYNGANLARRGNVVVITINHRLNVLGHTFLADLGGADFAASGAAGVLDIVRSLEWVRENAAEFGGDPDNVTIFGQSGGGRKVEALLTMPSAKGLFHRAIVESGAAMRLVERGQANRVTEQLLKELGLGEGQVREMQGLPLERMMTAYFAAVRNMPGVDQSVSGFSPAVDGKILPQHPFDPAASPLSGDVPVMIGSTRTEMTFQLMNSPKPFTLDDAGMRGEVESLLGKVAGETIDAYRKANPSVNPTDLYHLIASDFRYNGPTMKIAERRAALNRGPVYLYYFRWETPVQGGRLKSPHTIEIPFAFDNVKIAERLTGGGAEAMALADKVSDSWIAFARSGDPNNAKIPRWPAYNATDRQTLVIDNEITVAKDPIREQRLAMFRAMGLT